jgi:hypothetical protein
VVLTRDRRDRSDGLTQRISGVSKRRLKCALLAVPAFLYDAELTLACPGLELVALAPSAVALSKRQRTVGDGRGEFELLDSVNPFLLPEDDGRTSCSSKATGIALAAARYPERIGQAMRNLERRADVRWGWTPISSRSGSLPPRSSGLPS